MNEVCIHHRSAGLVSPVQPHLVGGLVIVVSVLEPGSGPWEAETWAALVGVALVMISITTISDQLRPWSQTGDNQHVYLTQTIICCPNIDIRGEKTSFRKYFVQSKLFEQQVHCL